jgi:replicative DNA helicase
MNKRRNKQNDAIEMPPVDASVEQIVLGCIIIDADSFDAIAGEFHEELFFYEKNKIVSRSILELYKKNKPIDLVTVVSEVRATGEEVDASYISNLTSRIASSQNLEYYLRILQEAALKRNIIETSSIALRKCFDDTEDAFDVHSEITENIDNALKSIISYKIQTVNEVHETIIRTSLEIAKKGGKSGVPTGLNLLDNLTNGFQKSDLIILAGRPSMGKTAAAISIAMFPAIEKGIPVAVFSLEMSAEQLVSRMQSALSEVNVSKIVKKQLTVEEITMIGIKSTALNTAPMYIDDTPNISVLELKGKCRKLVKEKGVQLVIVDYLQLMRSVNKTSSREQEIAEISRGLKIIAKELNIPIIALSQLSRGVEARPDKKPMLQDLRESGQIEQDADMVMFCYRPEYYQIDNYEVGNQSFDTLGLFMLIIAKHRNGELGEIPLRFIHEQTKLTNLSFNRNDAGFSNIRDTFVQDNNHSQINKEFSGSMRSNNDFDELSDDTPF